MHDPHTPSVDALETLAPMDLDAMVARPTETHGAGPTTRPADQSQGGAQAIETLAELSDGDALTVHGTLGVGGMAVVRLGRQERLGRMVAVKTLREETTSPGARVRLLREAWVTGRLEHPNIVPVHDVRMDRNGAPLVVLKRIGGVDWEDLLTTPGRLGDFGGAKDPLAWHIRVLVTVCHAVQFAHDRGVLHRDIKPSNVRIGEYGEVLLLDWGIAVSLDVDPSGRMPTYRPGEPWAGTPAYMAPEMLERGGPPQSRATDVYLLGAVLYRLLAGAPPHHGADVEALIASVQGPAPAVPRDAPAGLAALCAAALDPDPAARPASAAAFRAELERFLEQRAAAGITDAAEQKLAELRRATDLGTVEHSRLAAACEFGFKQALALDPGFARAQAGLDMCMALALEHALDQGALQNARTIADHADTVPPALIARLEAAEAEQEVRDREVAQLLLDEDASQGGWARSATRIMLGLGVAVGGVLIARTNGGRPGYAMPMGLSALILGAMLIARIALRDRVFHTRYNRRTWGLLAVMCGAQITLDLRNLAAGVPAMESQSQHPIIFAAGFASLAFAVDPRYAAVTVLYGLATIVALLQPTWLHDTMAITNGLMVLICARVWAGERQGR